MFIEALKLKKINANIPKVKYPQDINAVYYKPVIKSKIPHPPY